MGDNHVTMHILESSKVTVKTIQMTIDEHLLDEVDKATIALNTTRSAFIREALQVALRKHAVAQMEQQHAKGYSLFPLDEQELEDWAAEQVWEDD
ncbi:MAG TPA: ribbon-helix-helix domain-containing protein [Chloroflexia bacterium]|jgi:metal-responsive CopG/Arc/MetJ family transcriptional regulator